MEKTVADVHKPLLSTLPVHISLPPSLVHAACTANNSENVSNSFVLASIDETILAIIILAMSAVDRAICKYVGRAMAPFSIGQFHFSTKQLARERIRTILHGNTRNIRNKEDHDLMEQALLLHPEAAEKRKHDYTCIQIRKDDFGRKHFGAMHASGQLIPFSFDKCLVTPKPQIEYRNTVIKAARMAIASQIQAFRAEKSPAGPGFEVDHVAPLSFVALLGSWLQVEGLLIDQVKAKDLTPMSYPTRRMTNEQQLKSWQRYHKQHAKLELVTIEEHRHRTAQQARDKWGRSVPM